MIIQAGYNLPCKYYIAGVYLGSDSEDEEYASPSITSGSGKASTPITIDVLKQMPRYFAGSLLHSCFTGI